MGSCTVCAFGRGRLNARNVADDCYLTLARGAVKLSKQKVIVKHLDAIQNFGAMDILCTDKTGTLTQDKIVLENHTDISGKTSERVLYSAWLNSHYQTGLKTSFDTAVLEGTDEESARSLASRWQKIDEIPFDFERRRMSVVVAENTEHHQLVCKGALQEILNVCSRVTMARLYRSMTPCCVRLSGLLIR